jgi:hypothetical protein
MAVSAFHVPWLIQRREQPARWVFVATAMPLVLVALIGSAYGAFVPYAALAGICLVQAFYPTLLGWGVVLTLYGVGSALYLFTLGADVHRLMRGDRPQVFLNPYDSTFFLVLLASLLALSALVLRNRPVRRDSASSEDQHAA